MSEYENYITVIVKVPPGGHTGMIYYPQEYIDDQLVTLSAENAKLRARIAALESESAWIPVSERLPDTNTEILTCDSEDIDHAFYDGSMFYSNSRRDYDGDKDIIFPTHWRPLPAAPEVMNE